jgi:hypothetical protein
MEAEQPKSSKADHLKPWQFKPGQSGNPAGKPKGTISLKKYAQKYIQELTDEEKEEFLKGLNKKDIWEMAEGKAQSNTDVTSGGEAITIIMPPEVVERLDDKTTSKTTGGNKVQEEE